MVFFTDYSPTHHRLPKHPKICDILYGWHHENAVPANCLVPSVEEPKQRRVAAEFLLRSEKNQKGANWLSFQICSEMSRSMSASSLRWPRSQSANHS